MVLANPRRLASIVTRAGVPAWNKLYQTLRQSCEIEWAMMFPQHAVSAWLGRSEAVSRKHYLQVPDEIFDRAARTPEKRARHRAGKALHIALLQTLASARKGAW